MEDRIKNIFSNLGSDLCKIANVERFKDSPSGFHPTDIYKECKSVIVFAKRIPKGLSYVSPRLSYVKTIDIITNELDKIGCLASLEIEKLGGIAAPMPSDAPYEYCSATMEGHGLLSMRHAALLAGIGSMGKNTLIISKEYGNMINLGAVLTNLDLKSDPLVDNLCTPGCHLCLDHCPQKALDGQSANQKLCRNYTYIQNEKGHSLCNCNTCRVICPKSLG